MADSNDSVLAQVVDIIRKAVDEDWILDYDIDERTSFNDDLELESIEFVAIAEKLQAHYGKDVNFIDWLSGMKIDEIIALTVGDLVNFVKKHTKA